jgi:hypothetical protein
MQIKIINDVKGTLIDSQTGKRLRKGDVIDVEQYRAERAIKSKYAEAFIDEDTFKFDEGEAVKVDIEDIIDLSKKTMSDLRKIAKEKGVNTYQMRKTDIIKALEER